MKSLFSERLRNILEAMCLQANTPRSLCVKLLVEHGEFGQLVGMTTDPAHYLEPSGFFVDNAVTEFLRKCAGLETGIDTRAVAVAGFHAAEMQCAKTNVRISQLQDSFSPDDVRVRDFLLRVKHRISEWLGPLPRDLDCRFGPGATFGDRGKLVTIPDKMSSRPTCTRSARDLLPLWWRTKWARNLVEEYSYRSEPSVTKGNRFTTVPKDATKDRGIAIEPSINVYFQLGLGAAIRGRLKRIGIDLVEGQALHRQMACAASVKKHLSTIDLSSASDTVSSGLVRFLVPAHWLAVMETLRSPSTHVDGKWYHLQKFSSMGNGFTFELETLLFCALAYETIVELGDEPLIGANLLVYGDDILVPTSSSEALLSVLRFCGFSPNKRKTHVGNSPFRESCGGDYFHGKPVRAYYVKKIPAAPQDWIRVANGLRDLGDRETGSFGPWSLSWRAWHIALLAIPTSIRSLRGPSELGDLVIHDSPEKWVVKIKHEIRYVRTYRPMFYKIPWIHWSAGVMLASALYGLSSDGVPFRDNVSGYRIGWTNWC